MIAVCANPTCAREFKPRAPRLKCCSRDCGIDYKRTPEYRERLAERTRAWRSRDPEKASRTTAKMVETQRSAARREAQSFENRRRWADPDYKTRVGNSISAALCREDQRTRASDALIARWADPAWKADTSARMFGVKKGSKAVGRHCGLIETFIRGGLSLAEIAFETGRSEAEIVAYGQKRGIWPRPWVT